MITQKEYDAKRTARYERLLAAIDRAEKESSASLDQAHTMAEHIPFGQPILVGHHSEKRDRAYRGRIENKYRKGFEFMKKADELRARAEAAAKNTTIFSDDPAATEKLEDKLSMLEQRQEMMKAANKLVRKNDRDGLLDMGFSPARVDELFTPDCFGGLGFAKYQITNNGANIRAVKERIAFVAAHANDITQEFIIGEIRIIDNAEDNRLQMFFPGKPNEQIRDALKSSGFHWTPSVGAWQRYRGSWALRIAKEIAEKATL